MKLRTALIDAPAFVMGTWLRLYGLILAAGSLIVWGLLIWTLVRWLWLGDPAPNRP